MRAVLLVTLRRGRRGRTLHNLHRKVVLASTVGTALIALLLQHLLGLGVCKTQQQFHTIVLHGNVVELAQDVLGDIASFEAASEVQMIARLRA